MPKPRKGETLSLKEKVFCLEYVKDWNATRAAKAAGYSEHSAASIGPENLKKPQIQAEIKRIFDEKAMSAEEVLARLADQARGTHRPFIKIDKDGFVYFDFSQPEALENLHLIKKIKTKRERQIIGKGEEAVTWEGEWVEVELHDPQSALQLIGRAHKLFNDNINVIEQFVVNNLNIFTDGQLQRMHSGENPLDVLGELLRENIPQLPPAANVKVTKNANKKK